MNSMLRVGVDPVGEIDERPVAHHRDAAFGQRGGNGFGDFEAGKAGLEGAPRAVGKGDVDHNGLLGLTRRNGPA